MSHVTKNPQQVAVVGATGYSGFELARILLRHPKVQSATFYVRDTDGAKCLAELFPQLRGVGEAPLRTLSVEAMPRAAKTRAMIASSSGPTRDASEGAGSPSSSGSWRMVGLVPHRTRPATSDG